VSKELSAQSASITTPAIAVPVVSSWVRPAGIVLAGSALVAVCAHVALPLVFTPVPLTLGPLAVLLLGLLLSPRLAAATLAALPKARSDCPSSLPARSRLPASLTCLAPPVAILSPTPLPSPWSLCSGGAPAAVSRQPWPPQPHLCFPRGFGERTLLPASG